MSIKIVIADDHGVLRAGLRVLLEAQPDIEVVGEAADGREALCAATRLRPDVLLLDITMPNLGGLEALQRLKDATTPTRVLVLTMHDDIGYLRQCIEAGAMGYITKSAADTELVKAIRAVYSGRQFLDPMLAGEAVSELLRPARNTPARTESVLSDREKEVLRYIARGYTNKETAHHLFLSVKTVETYRTRLMQKLGLSTRAELVRYALDHGYMDDL